MSPRHRHALGINLSLSLTAGHWNHNTLQKQPKTATTKSNHNNNQKPKTQEQNPNPLKPKSCTYTLFFPTEDGLVWGWGSKQRRSGTYTTAFCLTREAGSPQVAKYHATTAVKQCRAEGTWGGGGEGSQAWVWSRLPRRLGQVLCRESRGKGTLWGFCFEPWSPVA